MKVTIATDNELLAIAADASAQRNLPLFDQATSERLARPVGDLRVENHLVAAVVMNALPFRCPLCGRIRRAFGQPQLEKFTTRGYCTFCWTGEQIGRTWYAPWSHAERRRKYLDAALEQGFAAKALQFAADAPQRQRLRDAYRRCEAQRHELVTALERVQNEGRPRSLEVRPA